MAISGADINQRIEALIATQSVCTQGLWYAMRRIIEHPDNERPSYLWRDRADIRADGLAQLVKASTKMTTKLLWNLKALAISIKEVGEFPLIKEDGVHCLHSPALLYLKKRLDEKAALKAKTVARGLRNPRTGVTAPCGNPPVTPVGSPPSSSPSLSPTPPLTTPPHSPLSLFQTASQFGAGDSPGNPSKVPKPRTTTARKTTEAEAAAKEEFDTWWIKVGFPSAHHGVEYAEYTGGDAGAVWKLLRSQFVKFDLAKAQEIAVFYLAQPEMYGNVGHRLTQLGAKLGTFIGKFKEAKKGHHGSNGNTRRANAARREYESDLPTQGRRPLEPRAHAGGGGSDPFLDAPTPSRGGDADADG